MKFFVLPPMSNMELMHEGTGGYFCLAHLYKTNDYYKEWFLKLREEQPDAFILLDNGAAEQALVTQDVLLDVVEELKPTEVIAPDVLNKAMETATNLISFKHSFFERGLDNHTNIFFCPQGDNMTEWMQMYLFGLHDTDVSTIGLSKIALPHCMFNASGDKFIAASRQATIEALHSLQLLQKPLHLLGAETPLEFTHELYNHEMIRSTDSCFSVWAAMNGQDWNVMEPKDLERIPTPHDYFHRTMNATQIELALSNIKELETIISKLQ